MTGLGGKFPAKPPRGVLVYAACAVRARRAGAHLALP